MSLNLVEREPKAKGSVPVGISLCLVLEPSGRSSRYLQAELFVAIVMGSGSMHLESLDLSICVESSVQCGLTPKQNCSLQFRPVLENGDIDFPKFTIAECQSKTIIYLYKWCVFTKAICQLTL